MQLKASNCGILFFTGPFCFIQYLVGMLLKILCFITIQWWSMCCLQHMPSASCNEYGITDFFKGYHNVCMYYMLHKH